MRAMTKLGKYVIGQSLGKGAMGTVYEAFDPVIQRTVAIKTMLPAQLGQAEAATVLARFKQEAQAAGRLNHPGIVAVYDYGEVVVNSDATMVAGADAPAGAGERVAFIAMEFVKGRELKSYFDANERFPLHEIARIMGEILAALEHAHANGVTHRDIKPGNLIMLADGRVKVADFGIARIETSELTQVGEVMGTPSYMSPEQFQGRTVDLRSDIFSCGVILYQFLTGEKPFVGNTTTIMYKVLGQEPLPPSTLNMSLPPDWDLLVSKAMAKNPDHRFQSAGAFAQAIRETIAHQASAGVDVTLTLTGHAPGQPIATALGADSGAGHIATAARPAPQPTEAPDNGFDQTVAFPKSAKSPKPPEAAEPPKPKNTGLVVGGVAALLLLLGIAGAYLLSGSKDMTARPPAASVAPAATPQPAAVDTNTLPTATPTPAPLLPPAPVPTPTATATPTPTPAPAPVQPEVKAPAPVVKPPDAAVSPRKIEPPAVSTPAAPATREPATQAQKPVPAPAAVPAPAPEVATPKPSAAPETKPEPARASARPIRCALILQKAAMSETLSAEDRQFLSSSCQ